jgi:hypothetical protein
MPDNGAAIVSAPYNVKEYEAIGDPSTFAREFQGIAGRAPTAEETRRHLEYDRLAKSSALDPMSMAMIVAGSRDAEIAADRKTLTKAIEADRSAIIASLARIEKKRTSDPHPPPRVFVVAAVTLMALLALVAWIAPWPWPAPVREILLPLPAILAAFALGAVSGLGYFWLAPLVVTLRRRFGR